MPNGLDVANAQRRLDLTTAYNPYDFVIVKAGGANISSKYNATYYHPQVEGAIVAKKPITHYWMQGDMIDIVEQAQFFADNVYEFNKFRDNIMLDNEIIDDNKRLWKTGEVVTFLEEARAILGIPAKRCWVYANKSDFATMDVAHLRSLGYRIHLAWYPMNDNGTKQGDPNWNYDIWQYTQKGLIQNIETDFDYTALTLSDLWGTTCGVPETGAWIDGVPGSIFWKRMHVLAVKGDYVGSFSDSATDVNMWKGIQKYLRAHFLYRSSIDGKPGLYTYQALQRMAAKYGGYDGPIDGDPGPMTWAAVARYLNYL